MIIPITMVSPLRAMIVLFTLATCTNLTLTSVLHSWMLLYPSLWVVWLVRVLLMLLLELPSIHRIACRTSLMLLLMCMHIVSSSSHVLIWLLMRSNNLMSRLVILLLLMLLLLLYLLLILMSLNRVLLLSLLVLTSLDLWFDILGVWCRRYYIYSWDLSFSWINIPNNEINIPLFLLLFNVIPSHLLSTLIPFNLVASFNFAKLLHDLLEIRLNLLLDGSRYDCFLLVLGFPPCRSSL